MGGGWEPKASTARRWRRRGDREWGGDFPLPSRLGGLGKRRKLPRRGSGNWILYSLDAKEAIWWHVLHWIFTVSNDCHYFEKLLLFKLHGEKIFCSSHGGFNPHQPLPRYATALSCTDSKLLHWSNFCFWQRDTVPLLNTLVRSESLNSRLWNLTTRD